MYIKKYEQGIDYYVDQQTGKLVWTGSFLLNRGYCCNHDCRHCPYRESSTIERIDIVYEERRENIEASHPDDAGG